MTEEQLCALLRALSVSNSRPPGYFDRLLQDIHRRQRAELLRRPLWKIALERVQTLFGEHSMGPASYASSMAIVVVIGVTAIGLLTPRKVEGPHGAAAAAVQETKPAQPALTLQSPVAPYTGSQPSLFPVSGPTTTVIQPHYILDTRPPSHEAKLFGL